MPRIAGVFAHPDDEVFCVGGTMAAYVDAGAEALIVSATRGEAGQIRDASVATRATLGEVREAELREACRCLGVQHVRLLDHLDGTLAGLDRSALVEEVGEVLDDFQPDVVVTFGPDGFYGHPDHVTVGLVVTEACARRPALRLYHSHFPRTRLLLLERLAGLDRSALVEEVGEVLDDFQPDVVVTFGPDGFYGHPDHVTVGLVVTEACARRPALRLYHSHFPRTRLLLLERLAEWLVELRERFAGPADFARVFSLFALETSAVGFADDHIDVAWFPPGVAIVEQGEEANTLYLILSGEVEVVQDRDDGTRAPIRRQGPGEFFGELGVAHGQARTANVVAAEAVTCLVFSRRAPTAWAGRGTGAASAGAGSAGSVALLPGLADGPVEDQQVPAPTAVIDVRAVIDRKIAALAAHRSQYPIEPEMFPRWLLEEMMGQEWFMRAQPAVQPETDLFG